MKQTCNPRPTPFLIPTSSAFLLTQSPVHVPVAPPRSAEGGRDPAAVTQKPIVLCSTHFPSPKTQNILSFFLCSPPNISHPSVGATHLLPPLVCIVHKLVSHRAARAPLFSPPRETLPLSPPPCRALIQATSPLSPLAPLLHGNAVEVGWELVGGTVRWILVPRPPPRFDSVCSIWTWFLKQPNTPSICLRAASVWQQFTCA